jgi:hypothetical protein
MRGKRVVAILAVVAVFAAAGARLLSRATPTALTEGPAAGVLPGKHGTADPGAPSTPAIRVRVLDQAGNPVAGAEVAAVRDGEPRPARAVSDARGRAAFEGLDASVEWAVGARAPGFAPTMIPRVRVGDFVQVVLTPGMRVHGTVRLGDGRPCAGARVRLSLQVPGLPRATGGFETRADEDGNYEFLRMPHLPVEVSALWNRTPGGPRRFTPAPDTAEARLDIELVEGGVVSGTVRDAAGRPLAGIWVIARRRGGSSYQASAETDADGAYHLGGLAADSYSVGAQDPSNRRRPATAEGVTPPRSGVDLTLEDNPDAPGHYVVRVLDSEGRPVRGFRVVDFRPGRDEATGTRDERAGADGRARSAQEQAGTMRLLIRAEAGCAETDPFEIRAGQETDLGEVRLRPAARVRGRVLDPDGRPAADARVFADRELAAEQGQPGPDGRWTVAGLPPGEGTIRVVRRGCEPVTIPWQAAAGTTAELGDVRLRRATGAVRIRARSASGAALAGAAASLAVEGDQAFRALEARSPLGADGSVEFREVPEGRWRASVSVPDPPPGWKEGDPLPMRGRNGAPFDLAEGESREVEIVLD